MQLLKRQDVAELFGFSVETISKYTNRKEDPIPHLKLGNTFLYPEDKINEWIVNHINLENDEKLFDVNSIKE